MGVVQCLFAGIGTQLFAHVRRGQPGGISRSVNFETFGNSMLVLFQCMTSALGLILSGFYAVVHRCGMVELQPCISFACDTPPSCLVTYAL